MGECSGYRDQATVSGAPTKVRMIAIPGGTFRMGSDSHYAEEAPARSVSVGPFWIDVTPVTNDAFAKFVADQRYATLAERSLDAVDYPGADPQLLVPGALVFHMTEGPVDRSDLRNWWKYVPGACWQQPEGPGSSLRGRSHHPVVHVAYEDAAAYAAWAGKELPSEAEWEFAAWGGTTGTEFPWGAELNPNGRRMANIWEGVFPFLTLDPRGKAGTTAVGFHPANRYGLSDMIGNVWEWTSDWYVPGHKADAGKACCGVSAKPGAQDSYDPRMPAVRIPRKVVKGGSFLCAESYCRRYRPAARQPQMVDTAMSHIGFRCVRHSPPSGEES